MKLLIAIATYKRTAKLQRCIESILMSTYKDITIVVVPDNNDGATFDFVRKNYGHIVKHIWVQERHGFVIGAWNKAVKMAVRGESGIMWDGFIGLCDDVELDPIALETAVKLHNFMYKDGDGVIGFAQDCPGHPEYTFKWFGQTLMGRKFIQRYVTEDYRICCPDYRHFCQDEEMYEYALSLGKFAQCPRAVLHHYHPSFIHTEVDETHNIIREGAKSPKSHDFAMQIQRRNNGFLWGRDFNLVEAKSAGRP